MIAAILFGVGEIFKREKYPFSGSDTLPGDQKSYRGTIR